MSLMDEIGQGLSGMAMLRKMMADDLRPGMGRVLDMRLVEAHEGRVWLEATPSAEHYNPMGTVHGGFAATMLDFACGYAVISKLGVGQSFSTLELKVAYHRPLTAETGKIRAEGTIISIGRRTAFMQARLLDGAARLCASATSTALLLKPDAAGDGN